MKVGNFASAGERRMACRLSLLTLADALGDDESHESQALDRAGFKEWERGDDVVRPLSDAELFARIGGNPAK